MTHATFMVGSFHLSRLHTVLFEALQSGASLSIRSSSLYAGGGGKGPFSSHKKRKKKPFKTAPSSCFPQLTQRSRRSLQISHCTSQAKSRLWQRQTGCCLKMWLMALPCALLGKPDTLLIDDPAHCKLLPLPRIVWFTFLQLRWYFIPRMWHVAAAEAFSASAHLHSVTLFPFRCLMVRLCGLFFFFCSSFHCMFLSFAATLFDFAAWEI